MTFGNASDPFIAKTPGQRAQKTASRTKTFIEYPTGHF